MNVPFFKLVELPGKLTFPKTGATDAHQCEWRQPRHKQWEMFSCQVRKQQLHASFTDCVFVFFGAKKSQERPVPGDNKVLLDFYTLIVDCCTLSNISETALLLRSVSNPPHMGQVLSVFHSERRPLYKAVGSTAPTCAGTQRNCLNFSHKILTCMQKVILHECPWPCQSFNVIIRNYQWDTMNPQQADF